MPRRAEKYSKFESSPEMSEVEDDETEGGLYHKSGASHSSVTTDDDDADNGIFVMMIE
jgi:hypothetical protein